jgi:two-component system, response regulator
MDPADQVDILLAEDNDADAELTLRALNGRMINSIMRVRDGVELLKIVYRETSIGDDRRHLPKLILLDLNMPRVNGIEVLQTLKSDDLLKEIPVILLTGSWDPQQYTDADSMGVAAILVKPFNFSQFDSALVRLNMKWALVSNSAA